jgi:hypothetical protein
MQGQLRLTSGAFGLTSSVQGAPRRAGTKRALALIMMKSAILAAVILASTIAIGGCGRHHAEGPAERAGRHIDHAVDKVEHAAHDVKRDLKK